MWFETYLQDARFQTVVAYKAGKYLAFNSFYDTVLFAEYSCQNCSIYTLTLYTQFACIQFKNCNTL